MSFRWTPLKLFTLCSQGPTGDLLPSVYDRPGERKVVWYKVVFNTPQKWLLAQELLWHPAWWLSWVLCLSNCCPQSTVTVYTSDSCYRRAYSHRHRIATDATVLQKLGWSAHNYYVLVAVILCLWEDCNQLSETQVVASLIQTVDTWHADSKE